MFIMLARATPLFVLTGVELNDQQLISFLQETVGDSRFLPIIGFPPSAPLTSFISRIQAQGIELVSRYQANRPLTQLVELGEFAGVKGLIVGRDVGSWMAALKAIGLIYREQDGGLQAFESDAELMFGHGESNGQMSRVAHLLERAQSQIPQFGPAMDQFANMIWGSLFHCFLGAVEKVPSSVRQLETFDKVEILASRSVQIARGVWALDGREAHESDYGRLAAIMETLPGARMGLIRKKVRSPAPPGGPLVGVMLADRGQTVDFVAVSAQALPPPLNALMAAYPDLDVPDNVWFESIVPAFQRVFGPPA